MTAKHTSETWTRQGNKIIARGRGCIAECPSPSKGGGVFEVHANLQLIAAAPELLAALVEAENALADYVPTIERTGASLNYGHKVIAQCRAAIARARTTGEGS